MEKQTGNKRLSRSRLLPFLFIGAGTGASLRRGIPLGSEDRSETPFPRDLLLQGGSLTGLVCTATQADAPASLPTPIFLRFASQALKIGSTPLSPRWGGRLDVRRETMDAGRRTGDVGQTCPLLGCLSLFVYFSACQG